MRKRQTMKMMSKKVLPTSLQNGLSYVAIMCQYKIIATEKNFIPFTYDMKEAVQGGICGVEERYIFMLMDTSHMLVLSVLEAEERMFKEVKDEFLVFNKTQKEEMLKVSSDLSKLVTNQDLETDREKIEFFLSEYPALRKLKYK